MAWKNILTDKGTELIASAFGATLRYTKIKLGSGKVEEANLKNQTDVTDYVKDFEIVGLQANGSTSTITARLNNSNISTPTKLSQMGLFASINDGEEVLLMLCQTDAPSTIPTQEEQPGWVFEPQIDIVVANIANFTATINWNAYAKITDIDTAVKKVNENIDKVKAEVTKITTGDGGINTLNADENTEGSIDYKIKQEKTRALSAEAGLGTRIDSIGEHPVILQADTTKFRVAEARVKTVGTGYAENDVITLVGGVKLKITSGNIAVGTLLTVLNATKEYNSNIAGENIEASGGSGSGMTVTLKTVYAPSDTTSIGRIKHTADTDPLVQKTYVDRVLKQAETFTTESLAQFASNSEAGFFSFGKTQNSTNLPSDVNDGTKAFDFSSNSIYSYSGGSWKKGNTLTVSDGIKIQITNRFLDGSDIENTPLLNASGVAIYKDKKWNYIQDKGGLRAVDNDTIVTQNSNGALKVKDQKFNITENTNKFVSNTSLTFKDFWKFTVSKINGLITSVTNLNTSVSQKADKRITLTSKKTLTKEPSLIDASNGADMVEILQNYRDVIFWIKENGGSPDLTEIFNNPENRNFKDGSNDCVMVKIKKFKIKQVIDGYKGDEWHPAFIVNGVLRDHFWVGKYPATNANGKAYSKANTTATVNINFDQAIAACNAKGHGWHLWTNAEAAAIALLCKKMGFMPDGNNSGSGQINTGTGGNSYFHNNNSNGIWGLNGNVWEWNAGLRTKQKAIEIIKNNNAADNSVSQTADSSAWIQTGYSYTSDVSFSNNSFEKANVSGSGANGITKEYLQALALLPEGGANTHRDDGVLISTGTEYLPLRGGCWYNGERAGVFALLLNRSRSDSNSDVGFRLAFCDL